MTFGPALRYQVFPTAAFPGNAVTLRAATDLWDTDAMRYDVCAAADEDRLYYQVHDPQRCEVRFFCGHHEVRFCGHGLLALAGHLATAHTPLAMEAGGQNGQRWQLHSRGKSVWIGMAPIARTASSADLVALAALLEALKFDYDALHVFANAAWVATTSSLDSLQKVNAAAVQHIGLNYDRLGALVLTTRLAADCYALRYFAPHYGKPEDSATGSAQGCLAPLWLRSGQGARVLQYSPHGVAEMQVQLEPATVWLSGAITGPLAAQPGSPPATTGEPAYSANAVARSRITKL
ncbi:MAG TPA: PhzF family phenazine biosynthesis protein [Pseudomonadaceae bacterium]|nr:PhzF family phenazine biosynthesis protein [Pseudomonadaceae bacterium]